MFEISPGMGTTVMPWLATAIMVVGVIFDLISKKYPNKIFLASTAFGIVVIAALSGPMTLMSSFLGFLAGAALFLPLVLIKAVGAGDMKLMAAFGLLAGPYAVLMTGLLGLLWAAAFGLIRIFVSGQGKALFNNMMSLVLLRQKEGLTLHKIPLTVGLLLGWLSHLILLRGGPA